jgi:hypothetical protein
MRSVHDNFVYAYFIDCHNQRITLHTSYLDCDPHEFTDVIFSGVIAHIFEHVLRENILLGIKEVEPQLIVQQHAEMFKNSWRWGWPPIKYDGDLEVLAASLDSNSVRGFVIQGSAGLDGWVLASNYELQIRDAPFRLEL